MSSDSEDIDQLIDDLSSQLIVINQLFDELHKNELVMNVNVKSKVESHESKTSVTSDESNTILTAMDLREVNSSGDLRSEPNADIELSYKEQILIMEKELRQSQTLIENNVLNIESMKRELQELKDKLIKYDTKSNDKDMEVIGRHEMSGQHSIEDMFAQIMKMNDKVCDFEVKIIDMQKKINEQKVLIEERNRTIEGLLSQQVMDLLANSDQLVQREEHKERVKDIGYEIIINH